MVSLLPSNSLSNNRTRSSFCALLRGLLFFVFEGASTFTSIGSITVFFSFTSFAFIGLFFSVMDAAIFGVLVGLCLTGLAFATCSFGATAAAFGAFTGFDVFDTFDVGTTLAEDFLTVAVFSVFTFFDTFGLDTAFAGTSLLFVIFVDAAVTFAFTFAIGATFLTDDFFTDFFVTGFAAALDLAIDDLTGEDFTGEVLADFFFATGFAAIFVTLRLALATGFVVAFALEVSFLAIFLLNQNWLRPLIIPVFHPFV
ncbi:MAG: hypothetical protein ABI210_14060 [Abditibacteriaceae bacterium]